MSQAAQYDIIGDAGVASVGGRSDSSPLLPITSSDVDFSHLPWYSRPATKTFALFSAFILVICALALAIGLTLGEGRPSPSLADSVSLSSIINTLNQF